MAHSAGAAQTGRTGSMLGVLSLCSGLLACIGVTAIWLVSGTTAFDMPGWLRIASGWAFPVGVIGALGFGVVARMRHCGTGFSTAGFVFAGIAVVEFVVMIAANPY